MFRRQLAAVTLFAATLGGCSGTPTTVDGVTILRYGLMTGSPAAQTGGTIKFLHGCVAIDHGGGWVRVAIWPPSARLDDTGGQVAVVLGDSVLREGAAVTLGGGGYKGVEDIKQFVGSVPEACVADEYWLVSEVLD